MSAYMTVLFNKVESFDWIAEYGEHAPSIIRKYGGEYLAISRNPPDAVERLEGSGPVPLAMLIFKFPSAAAARSFLESPEYAPHRKARRAGSDADFFVFENFDEAPQFATTQD